MAEARGRANWAQTSTVLALIANVNRDPKKTRAFRPADFNPFETRRRRRGVPLVAENLDVLKAGVWGAR
ncbi:MAG: hypothetical protein FJ288_19965 [Planctomycetes bacterium]|nr:hypothetical protein [Planctomycetota bacterium]